MMTIANIARGGPDWRRRMGGELFWIFLVKLAALTLLWLLFFSAAHRAPVDGESVSRQLGIPRAVMHSRSPSTPARKETSHG